MILEKSDIVFKYSMSDLQVLKVCNNNFENLKTINAMKKDGTLFAEQIAEGDERGREQN